MIFARPFLLVCVDCALVVCTHSHTKPLGGYPLGCVVWVLPCAVERVGVVDLVKRFVVSDVVVVVAFLAIVVVVVVVAVVLVVAVAVVVVVVAMEVFDVVAVAGDGGYMWWWWW